MRELKLYERLTLISLLSCQLIFLGCSGGGTSMDDMKRRAIRRKSATTEVATEDSQTNAAPAPAVATKPTNATTTGAPTAEPNTMPDTTSATPQLPVLASIEPKEVSPTTDSLPVEKSESYLHKEATIRNLERLGTAMRAYVADHGKFPSSTEAGLSWRVALLPYLGENELYKQFNLEESFLSVTNTKLRDKMPAIFRRPGGDNTHTNYLMVKGKGAILNPPAICYPQDIEGTCIALVEAASDVGVPWIATADFELRKTDLANSLGSVSQHGFFCVLADGNVVWISNDVPDRPLYDLCLREGGDEKILQAPSAALALEENEATEQTEETLAENVKSELAPEDPKQQSNPVVLDTPVAAKEVRTLSNALAAAKNPTGDESRWNLQRHDIPSGKDLTTARNLLRELYQDEYAAAKSTNDRVALAKQMAARVSDLGADIAGQFAVLDIVRQIAIQAGDVSVAFDATDQLISRFNMPDGTLLDTFEKLVRTANNDPSRLAQLVSEAEQVFDELVVDERYSLAERLSQLAATAASRVNDDESLEHFASRRRWAAEAKRLSQAAEEGLAILEDDPNNTRANGDVGKFLCLVKDDWENGLVILANGNDRSLKRLAELEITHPAEAMTQLELADLWWKEADAESPAFKSTLQSRAKHWYEQALPGLPAGLVRIRVERRIEELDKQSA